MPKLRKVRFGRCSLNYSASPIVSSCVTVRRCLMRWFVLALSVLLALLVPAGLAESELTVKDLQSHPFGVDFPSGSNLRLHLRSGEFRIVGHSDNRVAVHLGGRNADNARDLTVRFRRSDNTADLRVFGGPKNDLEVTIEVPSYAMLLVRMPAGDLSIEGVSGDKDVELHFGDLTISVGNAAEYSHVDASVMSGGLEAAPFGESHGGLFRSFEKNGTGKYKLHAHVGAGDLTLR
jgi:hypothetical protein